jgi:diadenosine tetraphosphatase ApaH/serine/threonine PP2A family protein phosphatase
VTTVVKRVFIACSAAYISYLLVGLFLVARGTVSKLYFFPGWAIKGPHHDQSLVFYLGNKLFSKRIAPDGARLQLITDTLSSSKPPTITCFVAPIGRSFQVPLRAAPTVPASTYAMPEKLLALSDIEGNFVGFVQLLRGAGVVDGQLNWQFGKGHLVLVGDFFDRGLNVTECLWLIYKLEQEAIQAGGSVHFIMGNHERMNLMGHYNYVRRKYRINADTLGIPYARWYDRTTVLGQWLRTKNVAERIGYYLFVHGGISPALAARRVPLSQLNDMARASIDVPVATLSPLARLATQPPTSPDWYRGLVLAEPTEAAVAHVLATYAARHLVVGHTPVEHIQTLYHGKVIALDVPHQKYTDQGEKLEALWAQPSILQVITSEGQRTNLPGF